MRLIIYTYQLWVETPRGAAAEKDNPNQSHTRKPTQDNGIQIISGIIKDYTADQEGSKNETTGQPVDGIFQVEHLAADGWYLHGQVAALDLA